METKRLFPAFGVDASHCNEGVFNHFDKISRGSKGRWETKQLLLIGPGSPHRVKLLCGTAGLMF